MHSIHWSPSSLYQSRHGAKVSFCISSFRQFEVNQLANNTSLGLELRSSMVSFGLVFI